MKFIQMNVVKFKNILEYINNYVGNGEYFIPVSSDITYTNNNNIAEDQYDPTSMKIYQRQNDKVALKNNKAIFDDINISNINIDIDSINEVAEDAIEFFRPFMGNVEKSFNGLPGIHLWIPLRNGTPKMAIKIDILDKVSIIIS